MLQCKDSNEFVLQRVVRCTRKLIHSEMNKTFFNKKKHDHGNINKTYPYPMIKDKNDRTVRSY